MRALTYRIDHTMLLNHQKLQSCMSEDATAVQLTKVGVAVVLVAPIYKCWHKVRSWRPCLKCTQRGLANSRGIFWSINNEADLRGLILPHTQDGGRESYKVFGTAHIGITKIKLYYPLPR